jgi:triosephosphate isomerase
MDSWLFVNFKVYESASGANAVKMAKACEAVSKKTGVKVVPVVSAVDLRSVCGAVSIPVFCQHLDAVVFGKGNGKILAEAVKAAGAWGVVVNHAEDPVSDETVFAVTKRAQGVGLNVLACAENDSRARSIAVAGPDFLAVELPGLIGTLKSVSTVDPDLVSRSVKAVSAVNPRIVPIMGAGVANSVDAAASLRLGTRGVFVAAAITTAADPLAAMMELAKGLQNKGA